MLDATGRISFDGGSYAIHVALERRFRIVTVFRDGLVWDTRVLPPSIRPAQDRYYVLLEGRTHLLGPTPRRVQGPHAFRVRARERSDVRLDVRAEGSPFRLLELHLHPTTELAAETWLDAPLPTSLLAACDRYERAAREGSAIEVRAARGELLERFVDAGWLGGDALTAMQHPEPSSLSRTWAALVPLVEGLGLTPPLAGLADRASVSVRQVDRDFVELIETFGLGTKGWRATFQRYRLSLAVVMLSAERATVSSVARAVGYSRPEAKTSAFRTAGLPPPRVVQQVLRDGRE